MKLCWFPDTLDTERPVEVIKEVPVEKIVEKAIEVVKQVEQTHSSPHRPALAQHAAFSLSSLDFF
jgi:hypothetical protein